MLSNRLQTIHRFSFQIMWKYIMVFSVARRKMFLAFIICSLINKIIIMNICYLPDVFGQYLLSYSKLFFFKKHFLIPFVGLRVFNYCLGFIYIHETRSISTFGHLVHMIKTRKFQMVLSITWSLGKTKKWL